MIDQPEAEALGDRLLQLLYLIVAELDHVAAAQVDQVVVMLFGNGLVARAAGAEIMAGDDAGVLEQLDRAIDGGDRDPGVHRRGPAIEFLDIGMVGGRLQHARDGAALLGHAHALGDAEFLEILVGFVHGRLLPDGLVLLRA